MTLATDGHDDCYGGVAQLGEHLLCKQGVTGSIPVVSTTVRAVIEAGLRWSDASMCSLAALHRRTGERCGR